MRPLVLAVALSLVLVGCVRSDRTGALDPSKGLYGPSGTAGIIAAGGGNLQASARGASAPAAASADAEAASELEATEATAATEASEL